MKQPQVVEILPDFTQQDLILQDLTQKELRLGRFRLRYRIMTVFSHPRG
jgi:hypothetical protein